MGVITVYSVINGSVVNSTVAHSTVILTLAFSANYQYLVSSAMDMNIRVLLWPSLAALLDITYYEPVKVSYVWTSKTFSFDGKYTTLPLYCIILISLLSNDS